MFDPKDHLLKASIMGENPDLYQLNKGLVDTGLMSDEEFWRIRKDKLQLQRNRLETRKEYKFSVPFLFAITNNLKDQIFDGIPLVRKLFDNRKISEEEFWGEFFRSYTHGDGSIFSKIFDSGANRKLDPVKSEYLKPSAPIEAASDAHYVISRLVDLTANQSDHHFEGFGNQEREYFEDVVKLRTNLLQEINETSARMLPSQNSVKLFAGENNDVRQSILLPDLTEDLYFEGQEMETHEEEKSTSYIEKKKEPISQPLVIDPNYKLPDVPQIQLVSLNSIPVTKLKIDESDNARDSAEREPQFVSIKFSDVQDIHRRFMEVLRHFWSVIPPLTVEKRQIAGQMITILDKLEQDYMNWKVRINIQDQLVCEELFKISFQGVNRAREIHRDLGKLPSSTGK